LSGNFIIMLPLGSPRWAQLDHAYGKAADIPALLAQLSSLPAFEGDSEPWASLWSALAHQGDVYTASFAAVPYVVHFLANDPARADSTYLQFPTWVEICRQKLSVEVPSDLADAYLAALDQLPALAAAALRPQRDEAFIICALSAMAVGKGHTAIGEVILELDTDVTKEFWEWFYSR
jgi:hypothetical protein